MAMLSSMVTAKTVLSTLGSLAATAVVARTVVNDFLPYEIRHYLLSSLHSIFSRRFSSMITIIIEEFDGLEANKIFESFELYIGALTKTTTATTTATATTSATRFKIRKPESENQIQVNVDRDEEIIDVFEGIPFRWTLHCHVVQSKNYYNPRDMNSTLRSEVRSFHLTFHKKYKSMALEKYIPHILKKSENLKQETKTIKLFTLDLDNLYGNPSRLWTSITLNHPASFETVALESSIKNMIIEDLERFVRRKEYYRKVGKAWKRGYLLYGPPGTGKSSLIAAMANYLKFDIYDLELSGLRMDSDLRKALLGTSNKSIVVVEDIDCSIELKERENNGVQDFDGYQRYNNNKVTLSGLLNFIDGLWSSCGDERIIIFTTNHRDKLDPALLRPGRMDVHIHMSYCTPCVFKMLANNYLSLKNHPLYIEIETLIEEGKVTPAEIAEQLLKHEDVELVLCGLVEFLKLKKVENDDVKGNKLLVSKDDHDVDNKDNGGNQGEDV